MRRRLQVKVYRTLPELDGCTDAECERMVVRAHMRRGDAAWVLPLLVGAGAGVAVVWGAVILGTILATARSGGNPPTHNAEVTIWAVALTLGLGVLGVLYVLVQRRMIIATLRDLANRAGCPYCEFSLVGLTPKNNAVKCPECGELVVLHDHGIAREDLLGNTLGARAALRAKKHGAGPLGAYTGGKPGGAEPAKRSPTTKVIPARKTR